MDSNGSRPPLIGIAPHLTTDANGVTFIIGRPTYMNAVRGAGGVPVILPLTDAAGAARDLAGLDGLVLPGGKDLPPGVYGEEASKDLEATVEPELVLSYVSYARAALAMRLPALGICLGCQVMNVALGGSLVQHLGEEHRGGNGTDVKHAVALEPGTHLCEAMGTAHATVASHHHQAVKRLGDGLKVNAHAPDGLVEGFERPEVPFFVGVQWHPERCLEEEPNRLLFAGFVRAAARVRGNGGGAGAVGGVVGG